VILAEKVTGTLSLGLANRGEPVIGTKAVKSKYRNLQKIPEWVPVSEVFEKQNVK
jgi:hypothetical protein